MTNTPVTFPRLKKKIFTEMYWEEVLIFLDDIVVYGLRLASYYRRFIKDFAKIAAPLHEWTQKDLHGTRWPCKP